MPQFLNLKEGFDVSLGKEPCARVKNTNNFTRCSNNLQDSGWIPMYEEELKLNKIPLSEPIL